MALEDDPFELPAGKPRALLSARAGKTTLIRILMDLCRGCSAAEVAGRDPARTSESCRRVGYLAEDQAISVDDCD